MRLSRPVDNEIDFDVLRLALAGAIRSVPQDAVSVSNPPLAPESTTPVLAELSSLCRDVEKEESVGA